MQEKKVVLVRHGETAWSLSGQHTGLTDIPLTENGLRQASNLARELARFSFSRALVSPLQRAKQTFELSSLTIPYTLDNNLVEWNYGDYEGLTSEQIQQITPSWNLFTHGALHGESIEDIQGRADKVLQHVMAISGDVVLFSSGHILRAIAARWLSLGVSFGQHLVLQTGSISILGYEHENRALLQWNKGVS